jgi:hypothetical protein
MNQTFCGISIEESDEVKMQMTQFKLCVNLIQMTLMKEICNSKDMMIQGFQDSVESRLISMMTREMHKIRFDSIQINHEFDSNAIDESDLQSEKHADPRFSTFH